jgi:hypothetical protein
MALGSTQYQEYFLTTFMCRLPRYLGVTKPVQGLFSPYEIQASLNQSSLIITGTDAMYETPIH